MTIHKIGSDLVRPQGPKGLREAGSGSAEEVEEAARVRRPDRVDISSEGRELSLQLANEMNQAPDSGLDQIRNRIKEDFYGKPSIAEKLAERLLADGIVQMVR